MRVGLVLSIAVLVVACGGGFVELPADVPTAGTTAGRVVTGSETISDQVNGTVTVAAGGRLTLDGQVTGNLVVESGGEAEVRGMVVGDLVNNGGTVTVTGLIDGSVIEHGGTTTVLPGAVVNDSPIHEEPAAASTDASMTSADRVSLSGTGSKSSKAVLLDGDYVLVDKLKAKAGCRWSVSLEPSYGEIDAYSTNAAGTHSGSLDGVYVEAGEYRLVVKAKKCGQWSVELMPSQ